MADPKKDQDNSDLRLKDLITDRQDAQLTQLLLELMTLKYGVLEIEVRDGKIRFGKIQRSFDLDP